MNDTYIITKLLLLLYWYLEYEKAEYSESTRADFTSQVEEGLRGISLPGKRELAQCVELVLQDFTNHPLQSECAKVLGELLKRTDGPNDGDLLPPKEQL